MTDFARIAGTLAGGGMRRAFVVPSIHSLQFLEAVAQAGIECLPARSELGAAHMADGYARVSGEPTGLITSTGPGAGNAVGGFATAAKDGSPVVHISTTNHPGNGRVTGIHGLHAVEEQSHWTAARAPVLDFGGADHTDELRDLLGQPFSVLIATSADRAAASLAPLPAVATVEDGEAALDQAVGLWLAEERRLLWIGGGARVLGPDRIVELAERTGAAVVTSIQGKDLFPADHPQLLGCTWNPPEVRAVGAAAGAVLVLGSRLGELSTSVWSPPFPPVVVDAGLGLRGHLFDQAETVQIQADVRRVAERVLTAAGDVLPWGSRAGAQARAERALSRSEADAYAADLLGALSAGLAPGDVVVADMTKLSFHAVVGLPLPDRSRFLFPGLLNMGFGLPAALGASIAAPDRHVVAIIGDGSLLSVLSELETARAAGGPVTVVLLDDNAYGLLEFRISADLAARTCQFPGPDWSRLGDAFGFTTADVKVDQLPGELAARPPGFRVLRVDATPIGNDWRRS